MKWFVNLSTRAKLAFGFGGMWLLLAIAITIAQDKESSIVHGMPGEAIKIEAATHILPPEDIAEFLAALSKKKDGGNQ